MKPSILVLAEVYLPGYLAGGPVRSLANLITQLGDDFDWKVITTDRDFNQSKPYDDVPADTWVRVGKADVYYLSQGRKSLARLLRLLRETPNDLLYLNSFFSPAFSIVPMVARWIGVTPKCNVLIAPRGEFSAGAYRLKSWKKIPFVHLARLVGIYKDAAWHASTEHEAADIAQVMGPRLEQVHIARNLSAAPSAGHTAVATPQGTELRVCFLSRISRKKNLDFALRVLADVTCPVVFTVYGPKEDALYWGECEALIAKLPAHVTVKVAGALQNERVPAELAKHDLFFLPTRGENYGHVFVEAWTAGLPVLISDQTPWRGLAAANAGWDLPLADAAAFVRIIEEVATRSPEQRAQARDRCIEFIKQHGPGAAAVEDNRRMFTQLAGSEGRHATK